MDSKNTWLLNLGVWFNTSIAACKWLCAKDSAYVGKHIVFVEDLSAFICEVTPQGPRRLWTLIFDTTRGLLRFSIPDLHQFYVANEISFEALLQNLNLDPKSLVSKEDITEFKRSLVATIGVLRFRKVPGLWNLHPMIINLVKAHAIPNDENHQMIVPQFTDCPAPGCHNVVFPGWTFCKNCSNI